MIQKEVKIRDKTKFELQPPKIRAHVYKQRVTKERIEVDTNIIKHKNRNIKTVESFVMIQQLKKLTIAFIQFFI